MSPGLYFTLRAATVRQDIDRFIARDNRINSGYYSQFARMEDVPIKDRVAVELNQEGKMNMVLGGYGTLRLNPKNLLDGEKVFLLGASSTGVYHEGIPIILPKNIYHQLIDEIKENCCIPCDLIGRLIPLPTDEIPVSFDRLIPKYALLVEEVKNKQPSISKSIWISVAITYSSSLRELKNKQWSFVSFHPDKYDKELLLSTEWLHDYAKRYSNVPNPIILADFDESRQHFDKIEFSIKDLANGRINLETLAQYEDFLDFKITTNIMGDYFENVSNSTIINRSSVQNAFNKINSEIDGDTVSVLKQIAEMVEKSGNSEAGEIFNAFTEEIQKSKPKKSLLKSFWNGLTKALPTITSIAGVAEKVVTMIG